MNKESVLNIGFDDTDSPTGMCTTFLAYKIVDLLQKQKTEFLDFPKLIRFNPNIPWKTRGNGAVSLKIKTNQPSKIKKQIKNLVSKYSDTKNGANPGLVFFENDIIPSEFTKFSNLALWQLINRNNIDWSFLFEIYSTEHLCPLDILFKKGKYNNIKYIVNKIKIDYGFYQSKPTYFNLLGNHHLKPDILIKILDLIY